MSVDDAQDESSLSPITNRGLTKHSFDLVRRGLASLVAKQTRVIQFPHDKSIGALLIADSTNGAEEVEWDDWKEFGDARGDVYLPFGKYVYLLASDDTDDSDIEYIQNLAILRGLQLWGTDVTDAGLKQVGALTELHHLDLAATKVSDAGLRHLEGLTRLRNLDLSETNVSDAGLEHLQHIPTLRNLRLTCDSITGSGLAHLQTLVGLEGIVLEETPVMDEGLKQITKLPRLRWLDLTNTRITDSGLIYVRELRELVTLELGGTKITDRGLSHLATLGRLEYLSLGHKDTKLTVAQVTGLSRALPKCKIEFGNGEVWGSFSCGQMDRRLGGYRFPRTGL